MVLSRSCGSRIESQIYGQIVIVALAVLLYIYHGLEWLNQKLFAKLCYWKFWDLQSREQLQLGVILTR